MRKIIAQRFTRFEYLYRDASNFKAYGSVVLRGILSREMMGDITSKLYDGELFIAEQIGVPPLYKQLYEVSGGPTDYDHCWHEFRLFETLETRPAPALIWGEAEELLSRFRSIRKWDLQLSPHMSVF